MAIHGTSGVPIAIHLPNLSYTNKNMKAIYDREVKKAVWKKVFGDGPRPGQAEVLFPRNTNFRVRNIKRNDSKNYVSVVLEEARPDQSNNVLNMKFGDPL